MEYLKLSLLFSFILQLIHPDEYLKTKTFNVGKYLYT